MNSEAQRIVNILLLLKGEYGDLNKALVRMYIRAYGEMSIIAISQDVGLSRTTIRRALQDLS